MAKTKKIVEEFTAKEAVELFICALIDNPNDLRLFIFDELPQDFTSSQYRLEKYLRKIAVKEHLLPRSALKEHFTNC